MGAQNMEESVPPFRIWALKAKTQRKIQQALSSSGVEHGSWESMSVGVRLKKSQIQSYCSNLSNYIGHADLEGVYVFGDVGNQPTMADLFARETLRDHLADIKNQWIADLIFRHHLRSKIQPIVNTVSGKIVGDEYLMLGGDENAVPIRPLEAFAAASLAGLRTELDWSLFVRHLSEAARNRQHPHPYAAADVSRRFVYLNLCQETIESSEFLTETPRLLEEHGLISNLICVEISEVEDIDGRALERLRRFGMRFGYDDMGSNGAIDRAIDVRRHRPAFLKLDTNIGRGLSSNSMHQGYVELVVAAAKEVGADVIVEGVESEADIYVAQRLGVDLAQAFVLAPPKEAQIYDLSESAKSVLKASAELRLKGERMSGDRQNASLA